MTGAVVEQFCCALEAATARIWYELSSTGEQDREYEQAWRPFGTFGAF